jgi:hypothetical protein
LMPQLFMFRAALCSLSITDLKLSQTKTLLDTHAAARHHQWNENNPIAFFSGYF